MDNKLERYGRIHAGVEGDPEDGKAAEAQCETIGALTGEPPRQPFAGRAFVIDIELSDDASMVTVYERGAPLLKRSMTYADVERLLDALPVGATPVVPAQS